MTDATLVMGLSLKFIDRDEILRNVLLVCHDFNEILRDDVLRQALLRSSPERLHRKRPTLWLRVMNIEEKFIQNEF